MFIQKIFHVHQSLHETRTRLAAIGSYRRQFGGVARACVSADGIGQFRFEPGLGYELNVEIERIADESPDRVLFRSKSGNVEVAGMIEYFPVLNNLTEVVLSLDYELKAPLARVVDSVSGVVDRFVNQQLRRMQAHFEGVGTIANHGGAVEMTSDCRSFAHAA